MRIHRSIDEIDPLPSRIDWPQYPFGLPSRERDRLNLFVDALPRSQAPALRIVGELAQKCADADKWSTPHGIGRMLTLAEIDTYPTPVAESQPATSVPQPTQTGAAAFAGINSPTPDSEGWISWGGGGRPVAADTIVDVRLERSRGEFCIGKRANDWSWAAKHEGLNPIVAYRLSKPEAPKAEPAENSLQNGGWVTWDGGECPAYGEAVEYRLRNGASYKANASALDWEHESRAWDITAYRRIVQST